MIELTVFLIFDLAASTVVTLYYACLFPFRFSSRKYLAIPILSMTIASAWISNFSIENMLLNFALNLSLLLLTLCFFKNAIHEILYVLMLEVLTLLCDGLSYYTLCLAFGEQRVEGDLKISLSGQVLNMLLFAVFSLLIAKKLKSIQRHIIPKSYWLLLLLTPSGSIFLLYHIYTAYQYSHEMLTQTFICVLIILVVMIGTIIIYGNIVDYFNVRLNNQVLTARLESFSNKQAALTELDRETRRIQHDLRNRLLPLMAAIEKGEYVEARKALISLLGEIETVRTIRYTGIEVIDDMVNYKAGIACQYGIGFRVSYEADSSPRVPFFDAGVALGIALDNAIEACQKTGASKEVAIHLMFRVGLLYIRIENDMVGGLKTGHDGEIVSTKPNAENHGLGINSIKNLAHKNGGDVKFETDNGKFIVTIIIPAE